jgi:glutathione S-transferase
MRPADPLRIGAAEEGAERGLVGEAVRQAQARLGMIAAELNDRTWCHGDRYTLADIAVGCCLGWVEFRKPGGIEWRAAYGNLARFYDRLMERAAFADTAPKA